MWLQAQCVTSGVVMISLALTVSGLRFLAITLITKSRSVIMPIDFSALFDNYNGAQIILFHGSGSLFEAPFSSIVTTGLLITSRTSIFVLNPISDMAIFHLAII